MATVVVRDGNLDFTDIVMREEPPEPTNLEPIGPYDGGKLWPFEPAWAACYNGWRCPKCNMQGNNNWNGEWKPVGTCRDHSEEHIHWTCKKCMFWYASQTHEALNLGERKSKQDKDKLKRALSQINMDRQDMFRLNKLAEGYVGGGEILVDMKLAEKELQGQLKKIKDTKPKLPEKPRVEYKVGWW